jgi:hypothetical protein
MEMKGAGSRKGAKNRKTKGRKGVECCFAFFGSSFLCAFA